jgi:transposase-like protein
MAKCPKCHSEGCTKDGIVKERQRYKCKSCGYRHTVATLNYQGMSPNIKRQALELYLEGLGFRSIGRFLNCSHVAVYNWIKAHGESIESIRSSTHIDIVEMDEMHTYIGSKKTTAGYGLLLIDMESDSSTALWVPVIQKQVVSYGKPSKTKM